MKKERKLLLWSIIFAIVYLLFDLFILSKIDLSNYLNVQNVNVQMNNSYDFVFYIIYLIPIIYFTILLIFKNIDLNKQRVGILISSIILFIFNIISGILGFIIYGSLDKKKKEKRQLPEIEYQEFTNKYICLIAFVVSIFLLFVASKFLKGIIGMIIIYGSVFVLMIGVFFNQLKHDFKIFKEYFKEYASLTFKTWLKSLLVMLIIGIIIQLLTNTSQSNNQKALQEIFKIYPGLIAFLSIIYAPFAEELMFRGVFRKFVKSKYLFIFISGITFGLLHVLDDSKTLAEFSYVIVYSSLGMFLASLYYKTNNLFSNILFHFFQNFLALIGMIIMFYVK